jgi:hypothetical protein
MRAAILQNTRRIRLNARSTRAGGRALLVACALAGLVAGATRPAAADIMTFSGADPGVGPGQPRPQSDAAAAAYTASAAKPGSPQLVTFESLPIGNFQKLQIAPGVQANLIHMDQGSAPGINFGISKGADPSIYTPEQIKQYGFNTTPGGSQFIQVAPQLNAGTATARFDFAAPIVAFGVYLTGLGNASGDLHMMFNDGADHDFAISGSPLGGVQFFGFTGAHGSVRSVSLEFLNVNGPSRDLYGIDDMHYTLAPVPEPSPLVLAALGAAVVTWAFRRRRRSV